MPLPILLAAALLTASTCAARAETVLRIAMTLADIPVTTSQPNQGAEGWRFIGATLYDGFINWDLTSSEKSSGLVPGLATSWESDPADRRAWRLHVTAKAKPLVAKLRAIADEMTADAFAGIDPKDIQTPRQVLALVRERAGQFAVMSKAANQ